MREIEAAVRELKGLDTGGEAVLSVYLPVATSFGGPARLQAEVKAVTRPLLIGRAPGERTEIQREIERVARAAAQVTPAPRGLAIFLCAARDFLRVLELPAPPAPSAWRESEPVLQPLLELLDEFERAVVVLVDRARARFFRTHLNEIEELESHPMALPSRAALRSDPEMQAQHHQEAHMRRAAREVAERAQRLAAAERVRRILLGGTAEMVSEVRRAMAPAVVQNMVAEVRVPLTATPHAVLAAARSELERLERDHENQLVLALLEKVGRGEAVTGLVDTADAVAESNAHLLVYAAGAARPGGVCSGCGRFYTAPAPEPCPLCQARVEPHDNLVERLITRLTGTGGSMELVEGPAAARLAEYGGIGALLRHPVAAPAQWTPQA